MTGAKMTRIKSLDIVTSAKNEEENIAELYSRISNTVSGTGILWRLIICDNFSSDNTWGVIQALSSKNDNVLGLRMSRDFGFEGAIAAAIKQCDADAVVMMASDLQDPPEAILRFLDEFELGFDHVYQLVSDRPGSSLLRKANSKLFYALASRMSKGLIQPNSSIFRIMSRDMVSNLNRMGERNRFVRALVMYLGFKSKGISIPRESRNKGKSKANTRHVLGLALKGILSNSYGLLDLVGYFGIAVSALALTTTLVFAIIWLFIGVPFAGFGLLTGIVLLGFGFTFLALGIIAQYLSLIYEEVKGRPNFVVMEATRELKK